MTVRPILSDSRRRPLHAVVALCIMMVVVVVLAAGCISESTANNRTNNVPVNVTTLTSPATTVQMQCPVPMKTQCPLCPVWLTINPIADHHIGDIFEVNGTIQQENWTIKNAAKINVEMECYYYGRLYSYRTIWPKGIAIQHASDCEVKTWSYQVNLSSHEYPLEECEFTVHTMEPDRFDSYAFFNITPLNSDISVGGG